MLDAANYLYPQNTMPYLSTDRSYLRTVVFGDPGAQLAAWRGNPQGLRLLADGEQGDGERVRCGALVGRTSRAIREINSEDRERDN